MLLAGPILDKVVELVKITTLPRLGLSFNIIKRVEVLARGEHENAHLGCREEPSIQT